jgi:hypothetical protein
VSPDDVNGAPKPNSPGSLLPSTTPPGQIPGGYYYRPYVDNGPAQDMLSKAGAAVGQTLVALASMNTGRPPEVAVASAMGALGQLVSEFGSAIGGGAGFLIDNRNNIDAFEQNMGTLMQQLNDKATWLPPDPGD